MPGLTPMVRLLAEAVDYGLGCVSGIEPEALSLPTPCAGWDLADLLWHLDDSLRALCEAPERGVVGLVPESRSGAARAPSSPVAAVCARARELLAMWESGASEGGVAVGGLPLERDVVAFVGAMEIAVHGWDVAEACGHRRPIPAELARTMLRWAPLVVDDGTRSALFAPAVPLPVGAGASDRLVAYLGRRPGGAAPVASWV
ncbi:TIGR03086 family metal-binding protein [Streptomyces sp. NPDC047002]|uniref:TIGR03086 family metal-binding protein n=1 Tax=Streptomyces sp. NPDC047002 TaxID=3155475 RepID=UPI003453B02C